MGNEVVTAGGSVGYEWPPEWLSSHCEWALPLWRTDYRLTQISLDGTDLPPSIFKELSRCPKLDRLFLSGCHIGPDMASWKGLHNLTYISVSDVRQFGSLHVLSDLQSLNEVALSITSGVPAATDSPVRLPNLASLTIGCDNHSVVQVIEMVDAPQLRTLSIYIPKDHIEDVMLALKLKGWTRLLTISIHVDGGIPVDAIKSMEWMDGFEILYLCGPLRPSERWITLKHLNALNRLSGIKRCEVVGMQVASDVKYEDATRLFPRVAIKYR